MKERRITFQPAGPRPPFGEVARRLWGDVDFDSDGDSFPADSTSWTELTLINRTDTSQRVDIDPVATDPLQLEVRSESEELAEAVAKFLIDETKGTRIKCQ